MVSLRNYTDKTNGSITLSFNPSPSGLQVAVFKTVFCNAIISFFVEFSLYLCFSVIHRLPTRDAAYLVITDVLEFIHPLTVIEQHVTCHLLNRLVFYLGDAHFHGGERKLTAGFTISSNSVFLPTYTQQFTPNSNNLNKNS